MTNAERLAEILAATAGDLPRAISLAHRAKLDGLAEPLVHHLVAIDLKQKGLFEAAISEAGFGLQLNPNDAGLMTTVGFCLLELGRRQEAAQVFGVAVKTDPSSSEASYGYGWAAERLGALDSAESGFKRALALNPDHADAMAGLSGLAARRRDWPEARDLAERAISIDPWQTDAQMNLARVDLGERYFDAAIERLRAIIALSHLKPPARADARLLLGDALDGAGLYEEAFASYSAGKSELRELYVGLYGSSSGTTAIDGVNRLLAEFRSTPPESWSRSRVTSSRSGRRVHAFLIGFPRSGTTLLEQVLAAHPDVEALEERPVMIDAEAQFIAEPGGVQRLADIVSDMLEPFRDAYWKRVREFGVDPVGKVFVDKHPLATVRLPLISRLFPEAKIIFAVRDPRDVIISCVRRSFNMNAAMYQFTTIIDAAQYYDAVMTAGEIYLQTLPNTTLRLRYEDLVADFDGSVRGLCDFLDLEWTPRFKDFGQIAMTRLIATPSSTQVGRGLYNEGVGQWRRYALALEPVLPILQRWVDAFGYPAS